MSPTPYPFSSTEYFKDPYAIPFLSALPDTNLNILWNIKTAGYFKIGYAVLTLTHFPHRRTPCLTRYTLLQSTVLTTITHTKRQGTSY